MASRVVCRGGVLRFGSAQAGTCRAPAAHLATAGTGGSGRGFADRGPDRPDVPGRHPDLYPPDYQPRDIPDLGPDNPDSIPTPRRDPDIVPPRYPSPDVFPPPVDNPDMPEPPVPGRGPYMGAVAGSMRRHFHSAVLAGGDGTASMLLLKTDGGNAWMEASRITAFQRGFHSAAAATSGEHSGRGLTRDEQTEANQTRTAMEGVQKQQDDIPTQSYVSERGNTPPEVTPRVPTEAPDKVPPGSPPGSMPGYSHAAEPTGHIGKLSDEEGDVPLATPSTHASNPKVGPKASPGTPLDVPVQVPAPGFPK